MVQGSILTGANLGLTRGPSIAICLHFHPTSLSVAAAPVRQLPFKQCRFDQDWIRSRFNSCFSRAKIFLASYPILNTMPDHKITQDDMYVFLSHNATCESNQQNNLSASDELCSSLFSLRVWFVQEKLLLRKVFSFACC